jgi:2'-5' RNA ligase
LAARVLGKSRANVKLLRRSTKARIIVIEGTGRIYLQVSAESQEKLDSAIARVRAHVESIRQEEPFTHFVAVPCDTDRAFVAGCRRFLDFAQSSTPLLHDAYDNLHRLHITLMTLRLPDEGAAQKAATVVAQTVGQFNWDRARAADVAGINTFTGEDGPRLFYAQLSGTDEKVLLGELQQTLAYDLRGAGFEVIEVIDIFHITILRRAWAVSGMWGNPAVLEAAAEFALSPAPLVHVALCKRWSWKPGEFYETYGRNGLYPAHGGGRRDA